MKFTLTTCAILLIAAADVSAQSFSAGLRTGSSCWSQRGTDKAFPLESVAGQRRSWDQELFVRLETRKRWAFEAGLLHGARTSRSQFVPVANVLPASGQYLSHDITRRIDLFDLSLSAQYDVSCARMQACPLLRRFKSYAGVLVAPSLTRVQTRREFADGTSVSESYKFQAWAGISHTVVFQATPRLNASAVVDGRVAPAELFSARYFGGEKLPAVRMGLRVGLAYRFTGKSTPKTAAAQ